MQPTSTGSFGAASGGITPELQAALQRRSTAGATGAVTQGAPGYDPTTQPATPPTAQAPMPPQSAQQSVLPQTAPEQAAPTMPFDPAELKQIVGALTGRLKLLGGIQQAVVGIPPTGG